MTEFDRKGTALTAVADLSDNEINRVAGLRVTGEKFEELMGEVRDALRRAYQTSGGARPEPWAVVDDEALVPVGDSERAELFIAVDAVWHLRPSELSYDPDDPMSEFAAAALREAFTNGVAALIEHVEDLVDTAEQEHIDDEDDDG
jgi:hypothetical protein